MTPAAVLTTAGAWYTTWWGVGLILIGAFAGYKAFVAKPKKPAAA